MALLHVLVFEVSLFYQFLEVFVEYFMIFSAAFPPAAVLSVIAIHRRMKLYFPFLGFPIWFSKNRTGIYMIKIITSSSCVAVALAFGQTTTLVPVSEQNSNIRMRSSTLVRNCTV